MHRLHQQLNALSSSLATAMLLICTGLFVANWPLIATHFSHLPGDLGDSRFINYLLEHSWRWANLNPEHPLWDPPYYYPVTNVGAFSDIMVASGPLYWVWRALGLDEFNAFSLWIMACHILNVSGAWLILRKLLGLSPLAAIAGALLFTTGNPRLNQLNHLQMLPQFFVLMSLAGIILLIRIGVNTTSLWWRLAWSCLGFGGIALQMYTGFYYGWFLILAYAVAAFWIIILSETRHTIIPIVQINLVPILTALVFALVSMIPWIRHYLAAVSLNPTTSFDDVYGWLPRWESWLYMGPTNWLYSWSLEWNQFAAIPDWSNHEHRLGIGALTLLLVVTGFLIHIRHPWILLIALVSTTLVMISTIFPGGFTLWRWVFDWVPGASAVRTVSRVGLFLLIPMSFGLALSIDWLVRKRMPFIAVILIAMVLLEQGNTYPTWSKEHGRNRGLAISNEVQSTCHSFLYSPVGDIPPSPNYPAYIYQLDAMWAGLYSDVPTINGYGHNVPPGWSFSDPATRNDHDHQRLVNATQEWELLHEMPGPMCHITLPSHP